MNDVAPILRAERLLREGDNAAAERLIDRVLAEREDADALALLAVIRRKEGRVREARQLLERAIDAEPGNANARYLSFELAFGDDRYDEALAHIDRLPEPIRSDFNVVAHEAEALGRLGQHDRELPLYDRLVALRPDLASIHLARANALRNVGRTEEAIAAARTAMAMDSGYLRPWWLLSDLKSYRFSDEDFATMTALLAEPRDLTQRAPLHFALGKAHEDRGDIAQAFDHYRLGNLGRQAAAAPTRNDIEVKVERSIALFDRAFLDSRRGVGDPSEGPIFIVGLQRSGSTLIEQILSSHPAIEGTSELPIVPQLMREIAHDDHLGDGDVFARLAALPAERFAELGRAYLDRSRAYRSGDRPYFVDKLPGNWSNIGLIRLILPNARIVDARRHPMATGLSNFRQNYGDGGRFTHTFPDFARYYRAYLRHMTHFERLLPGGIHRVVNERLIEDFEPTVRALLAFVGVDFDLACLDFHTNKRAVRTPSAEQVRRPINRDGMDLWHRYRPFLDELATGLGPALDGWDVGPGEYDDG